jgi:GMP synthase (glutamine-hydrolysing)
VRDVLVVKCGNALEPVRSVHGDYDRWFAAALGPRARLHVVAAHRGARLPDPRRFDAVIATGSPRSVLEAAPWMVRTGDALVEAATHGVPVLAVCFGHQLVAASLGAEVRQSPRGRELGTISCALTAAGRADPLFAGVPRTFEVQATHGDEVAAAPPGAVVLAGNAHSPIQAFRVGRRLWAVQFHPELSAAAVAALVRARVQAVEAEARTRGEDPAARVRTLLAGIHETPSGTRMLENFLREERSATAPAPAAPRGTAGAPRRARSRSRRRAPRG